LKAGKDVFLEKPVFEFARVMQQAQASMKIVLVGFHRRFESEFILAKKTLRDRITSKNELPSLVRVHSYDPITTGHDSWVKSELRFVMAQSMCHDVDMSLFIFDNDIDITWLQILPMPHSGAIAKGLITYKDGRTLNLELVYRRENPNYYQKVELFYEAEKIEFGHEYDLSTGTSKFKNIFGSEIYEQAYIDQFEYFWKLVKGEEYDAGLLRSYEKTFGVWGEMLEMAD
jgi:predicted dehydrogenase